MNHDEIRVLFVDDDPLILRALKRVLRDLPFASWFTTEAEHALQIVGEEAIDVVVSDLMMPAMSGLSLLSAMRDVHPGVVRILLTGEAASDIVVVDERLLHRVLHKPWDNQALRAELTRIVEALREHRGHLGDSSPIRAA